MALGWYPVWMPVTVGYHRGLSWDSSFFTSLSMTRRRQQKALLWSLQMSQNLGGAERRPVDRLEGQAGMDAVSHRWEQSCAALYKQKMWYKMYRSFSASSSSLVYSAALLVSCCILFSLSLQVNYWALTSAKGQETSLHRPIFISAFTMLLFPFLSLRPR